MTSSGICPSCQGEVTLYEEHWDEYGRTWVKFTGKCWNCGCLVTDYPHGFNDQYEQAEKEHYQQSIEGMAETMTPEELMDKLGPERFPYFKGYVEGEYVCSDITMERCIARTSYHAWKKGWRGIEIQRFGRMLVDWNSHDMKESGQFSYILKTSRREYRNRCDDSCDYYDEQYACKDLAEVEKWINHERANEWTVFKLGDRNWTLSGKNPNNYEISKEQLHRLLEVMS